MYYFSLYRPSLYPIFPNINIFMFVGHFYHKISHREKVMKTTVEVFPAVVIFRQIFQRTLIEGNSVPFRTLIVIPISYYLHSINFPEDK